MGRVWAAGAEMTGRLYIVRRAVCEREPKNRPFVSGIQEKGTGGPGEPPPRSPGETDMTKEEAIALAEELGLRCGLCALHLPRCALPLPGPRLHVDGGLRTAGHGCLQEREYALLLRPQHGDLYRVCAVSLILRGSPVTDGT